MQAMSERGVAIIGYSVDELQKDIAALESL